MMQEVESITILPLQAATHMAGGNAGATETGIFGVQKIIEMLK